MKKILVATEKPFAKAAVDGIKKVADQAGFEVILLEKYPDFNTLSQAAEDVDAMIIRSDKVTQALVDGVKNLKIVVRAGAGYDNVDLDACTRKGIVVMNTPGQNSNAVAELAIGMMIYMARNLFTPGSGSELKGKTLGIQAFGNVGKLVAEIAKNMGMKVIALDPFVSDEMMKEKGVEPVHDIKALYSASDYLSIHIPALDSTKKSIGYELATLMPKGATLINTARKEVIDEDGLYKAMQERSDLKYATDVAPDTLTAFADAFGKRFFTTPKKMGAETAEANINAGIAAAEQIVDYLKTGNTRFKVNK